MKLHMHILSSVFGSVNSTLSMDQGSNNLHITGTLTERISKIVTIFINEAQVTNNLRKQGYTFGITCMTYIRIEQRLNLDEKMANNVPMLIS